MRRWLTWGAIVLGALVLVVNAGAAAAYLYDSSQAHVIADGVTVAGVDVGGLSDTAARARLRRALLPRLQQPLAISYHGRSFGIDPQRAGLRIDVDRMVAEAVRVGRQGTLLHRFVREVRNRPLRADIGLHAVYSSASVRRFVRKVARAIDRPAVSATVQPSAAAIVRVPARWGVMVRRAALARELQHLLLDPAAPRTIAVPTRGVRPGVTTAALARKYPAFLTVDREHFRLTFWKNLKPYRTYTIAVGQAGLETPAGLYHINDKQVDPSWHVPNSAWAGSLAGQVIPPGPTDPIKARWMGFWDGAGIHGTDETWSLGHAASHGCIRMAIPDVEQLYNLVPLGTPIYVG
jgi:lipoprotein-anchoring transpeptidase ErfK/SrfK